MAGRGAGSDQGLSQTPMNPLVTGAISILFYFCGAGLQVFSFVRQRPAARGLVLGIGTAAVINHALLAWLLVDTPAGYDLSLYSVAALITLAMVVLTLLASFNRPLQNLTVVVFPLAALTLAGALLLDSSAEPVTGRGPGFVIHVTLSILAYSVLTIAAIQALLVGWQERQLRGRRQFALLTNLAPLQTMERVLFEQLWIGLALLTASILSGFVFLEDMFAQRVVHHTVLALTSWLVFATLLWGRARLGWRGPTALRWTLSGFALLMLAYFGSKLVIEVILGGR